MDEAIPEDDAESATEDKSDSRDGLVAEEDKSNPCDGLPSILTSPFGAGVGFFVEDRIKSFIDDWFWLRSSFSV